MEELLSIASAVAALAAGATASVLWEAIEAVKRKRRTPKEPTQATLEDRLSDLSDLMRSSALVLEEVQAEIQARVALAEKAKTDAQEAEQLAQMNEAQRIAVARLVRAELASEVHKSSKRSFWQGFAVNFLFFVGGVVASIATTVWLGD